MRILIIDDNPFDAELARLALKSMPDLEFDHAEDFAAFKQKYSLNKYAAIISDYNLSGAVGTDIFLYVQKFEPGIPFIIISGALGEERAVGILRLGVTDYVLKDQLNKLPLALTRALKEADTLKAEKEGLQKLKESEEKFRKIFESISDVYYQTDLGGVYTLLSPSCFNVTGYYPHELIGKQAGSLNENSEEVGKVVSDILRKEKNVNHFEIKIIGKNGKPILISANISLIIDENGVPSGTQGMYRDITEKKKKDDALIKAQAASLTKSQFLANMSHEIRTPLNAVIGLTHLALKTDLTPKQTDYLKKIQSSSESLLSIINDILDFSKIEAGRLALEEVSFNLEEVFQKLADVITYKAYGKGLEIAFGINSDLPTHLIGDPIRLEQILFNLCSNAVKFTHEGEVVVKARLAEDYGDSVRLQFEVADTGIGMNKKQMSKLFEPFTQADDSISRKYGGTGLGLSIIKRLVELMDGTVWVKSEPGTGSKFYFTALLKKQKQRRKIPVPSVDLRKLRVLLVDDNKSARKILKEALESFSFEVVTVDSGIDAVHFLKNNNHHQQVKLVLMDWNMPEMDGLKAAEVIRQDEQLQDIRIIMMCTSYASDELYQKTEELGLSGILIKPIRYSRLYDTIMHAINGGIGKQHEKESEESQAAVFHEHWGHALLVEDNEINRQVASELLEGLGFTVDIAGNGVEAVDKIKESGTPSRYDLVLMDLQMPIISGYKATEEIRKLEAYRSVPIIAMTADAMAGVREKCLEVGMMDFITKPINPNQLVEVVQKWIKPPEKGTLLEATPTGQPKFIIPMVEGIDLKDGLGHLGGNSQLYYDLLIKFLDKNEHFISEVKKEFTSGDHEQGRRMIHTLKGMSGNLGMVRLHEICKKVEESLQHGPGDKFTHILRSLSDELQVVLESLRKNMVRKSARSHGMPLEEVRLMLTQMKGLLKNHDPEALYILKKIGMVRGYEKQMGQLEEVLNVYDFDAAAEIFAEIRNTMEF